MEKHIMRTENARRKIKKEGIAKKIWREWRKRYSTTSLIIQIVVIPIIYGIIFIVNPLLLLLLIVIGIIFFGAIIPIITGKWQL